MKLGEICEIKYAMPKMQADYSVRNWIQFSNLLDGNMIELRLTRDRYQPESCIAPQKYDILIKRINPTYVNVFDDIVKCLLCNNIMVVRVRDFNPYYIAFIIEQNLERINALTNNGSRFGAINRNIIEDIEVPKIDFELQEKIGQIWLLGKKKNRLMNELHKKEVAFLKSMQQKLFFKVKEKKNGK